MNLHSKYISINMQWLKQMQILIVCILNIDMSVEIISSFYPSSVIIL